MTVVTRHVGQAIELAKRHLEAGAHMIMIDSEGVTEQVREDVRLVDLFVDHSQIVRLECLRAGIWGTQDTWGRMLRCQP